MLLRVGDLGDRDAALDRGLQIDVVGADARGDRQLQLGRLGDPLGGQIGGPERLRDHDLRVRQLALEDRVRPVLVRGDDQRVAAAPRGTSAGRARRRRCRAARPGLKSIACGVGVALAVRSSARSWERRRARRASDNRRPGRRRGRKGRSPWSEPSLDVLDIIPRSKPSRSSTKPVRPARCRWSSCPSPSPRTRSRLAPGW